MKILIAEDDFLVSEMIEGELIKSGYEVIGKAIDGEQAVELTQNLIPDLVLMDIHLDGEKSGIETTKIIGEDYNLPVIYISGDSEKDTIEDAVLKNTYGFLTKPLHKETLQVTVNFAIAKHKISN